MIDKSISVIIPAYNEENFISKTVKKISNFLKTNFSRYEIIVVDDGSRDSTCEIVEGLIKEEPEIKLIKGEKNAGKGISVKRGVNAAAYEYVLFSDADLSTPIEEINKFIPVLDGGVDVAVGSRSLTDSNIVIKQGIVRMTMGKIFNIILQTLLFRGIKDTQCGFKCFKKNAAKVIFSKQTINGFCFDAEILYIAHRQGYGVKEIPIKWLNRPDSRVSILSDSVNMFLDLFKIKFNGIKGIYDNKTS